MLKSLYVKNYALIEEIEMSFSNGLNILTGETGAGKSILIGALNLILGERASSDVVRQNCEKAIVEGTFTVGDNEHARQLLHAMDYADGEEVIVRREVNLRGSSRAFINDSPAPISLIKQLGDLLVDLHGQHEHQSLLRAETHIHLLDNAGGLERLVTEFSARYNELVHLQASLHDLRQRESQLREKQEFYQYQLREIDSLNPQPSEDEIIQQELKILENSERIFEFTSSIHSILYEEDNSVRDQLLRARSHFDQLVNIDPGFADYRAECISAVSIIEELAKYVQSYSVRLDFSPARTEELRERLFALNGLRKRFGGTLESVIEYREVITREIELAQNFDTEIARLEHEVQTLQEVAGALAYKLSKKRKEVAVKVERSVENVLKQLGIEHGRFSVEISQELASPRSHHTVLHGGRYFVASASGFDKAEYHISTNLGEAPKPLVKVASGGEISRIMLALKTILAKNDKLPLLVFDEIDTGISGRIAAKVGMAMRDLAHFHQIIAITHHPQIAAMSPNHFVVEKIEEKSRTVTRVRKLKADEHIKEVAKLMSGEVVTESSLQMARELIES